MRTTYDPASRPQQFAFGFVSALLILLAPGLQSGLSAAVTCTDADYNGHYAFSSVGSLITLPPEGALFLGPITQSGRFNPDGKGKVPINTYASYNGYETNGFTPGATYSVRPNCIIDFDLVLPLPLGAPSTFQGILSVGGTQMVLMLTTPGGTEIVGQHIKQNLLFCSFSDFSGAFQIDLSGSIVRPKEIAGLYRQLGRLVSDGEGNFTASAITNYNGRIVRESFSGTYTVNSSCFVNLSYPSVSAAQTVTLNGGLGGNGEIVMVTSLAQGWGVSGTLRAQQGRGAEQLEIR